jgi:hypothetical protein
MPKPHPRRRHYCRYAERMTRRLDALDRRSSWLGWARLSVVIAGGAAAWIAFASVGSGAGWAVVAGAVALFYGLARVHRRVDGRRARVRRWQQIKKEHGARLRRDWDALPPAPTREQPSEAAPPPDEAHSFASGLNLTGPRSLLRLIDTCATAGGRRRLRRLLLDSSSPERASTLRRQAIVKELAPRALFRDRLALEGRRAAGFSADEPRRWSDRALRRWFESDADPRPLLPWAVGLGALGVSNVALAVLHFAGVLPPLWAATLPLYLLLYTVQLSAVKGLFEQAEELHQAFRRLRAAFHFLENRPLAGAPRLRDLLAPLRSGDGINGNDDGDGDGDRERRPSTHVRRVKRITAAASPQHNELLRVVNLLVPWDLTVAYLLRRERERLAEHLPAWLEVWHEVEALSALAAMADRRGDACSFPEIANPEARPLFDGDGLGHPLLPEEEKVRNSVRFDAPGALALVTGSNMAGKSTFLRTLGLNLRLAFAGGPVDARSLAAAPLRLFTCIDVTDSVTGGLSYFYAEVRRLHALMEAVNEDGPPLFYLIDEIFRGTNNRERLIGSRAYLRALAARDGLGAVATHDLELTELSEEIAALENYHFREQVEEDAGGDGEARMTFDYRLRRGPCPTTNALKIMRAAGLPTGGGERETARDGEPAASASE